MFSNSQSARQLINRLSTLLIACALSLSLVPAQSQEKQEPKKPAEDDIVRVNSNLVSLDVMVKDKKGKPVTGLKAEDFTISENGVPQKIEFFDSPLMKDAETTAPETSGNVTVSKEPTPRPPSAFPRNIVTLVLDGQSTELPNLKRVRDGIIKYIRERIGPSDSVALFSISGGLQLLQPFTEDKERLIAAVEKSSSSSISSKSAELRDINANIAELRSKSSGPAMSQV